MKAERPHARGSKACASLSSSTIPEKSNVWDILQATNIQIPAATASFRSRMTEGDGTFSASSTNSSGDDESRKRERAKT